MNTEIPIVLTGTIIPNTNIRMKHLDAEKRRKEYLNCINYYRNFAPVYFLENSSYPVEEDLEFTSIPNVEIRKFPVSSFPEKGRGFQEFEMIDSFIKNEKNIPNKFLKITGRYFYTNIKDILIDISFLWEITINIRSIFALSSSSWKNRFDDSLS